MVLGSSPVTVIAPSYFAPASSKEFLDIQATVECGFTLKRVRDMTRTYTHFICFTIFISNVSSLSLIISLANFIFCRCSTFSINIFSLFISSVAISHFDFSISSFSGFSIPFWFGIFMYVEKNGNIFFHRYTLLGTIQTSLSCFSRLSTLLLYWSFA